MFPVWDPLSKTGPDKRLGAETLTFSVWSTESSNILCLFLIYSICIFDSQAKVEQCMIWQCTRPQTDWSEMEDGRKWKRELRVASADRTPDFYKVSPTCIWFTSVDMITFWAPYAVHQVRSASESLPHLFWSMNNAHSHSTYKDWESCQILPGVSDFSFSVCFVLLSALLFDRSTERKKIILKKFKKSFQLLFIFFSKLRKVTDLKCIFSK